MDIEKYKASMPKCKDCTGFGWGECITAGENEVACKDFERKTKLTNGDRIRQMTDEQLAKFMCLVKDKLCFGCSFSHVDECEGISCEEARTQWLKQEVKKDASY